MYVIKSPSSFFQNQERRNLVKVSLSAQASSAIIRKATSESSFAVVGTGRWRSARKSERHTETAGEKGFRPVWKSKSAREHRALCSPRGHNYRAASARNPLLYINSRDSRLCRVTERATSLVTGGTRGAGVQEDCRGKWKGWEGGARGLERGSYARSRKIERSDPRVG